MNPEEIRNVAIITQALRMVNISYDKHTCVSIQIYLTKRLSEYIVDEKEA